MKEQNLEQLKREYMKIPIPEELDFVVKKTLKESIKSMNKKNRLKKAGVAAASVAAAAVILTVGVNSSPAFAKTLSDIPVIRNIVKVLTFKEYTVNEDTFDADIKVPAIDGLKNKELEKSLNEKYLAENKELYDQFMADMKELKENNGGHLGVESGYVVKTDNERILSVGRYVVNTVASSSTTFQYDTIDKKNEILITLPSLFKDESYVDVISDNIKEQMKEQLQADENKVYWLKGAEGVDDSTVECFDKISKDQSFYISPEGKLVISFNKYEVAPGYMGMAEFTIPTEILSKILAGDEYIK